MRLKFRVFFPKNGVKQDQRDSNTMTVCEQGCSVRARTCQMWSATSLGSDRAARGTLFSRKLRDPAPLQQNQTSTSSMCPQWDSWSILTKEGLMELGHIQPNGTCQDRKAVCATSLNKERNLLRGSAGGPQDGLQCGRGIPDMGYMAVTVGLQATCSRNRAMGGDMTKERMKRPLAHHRVTLKRGRGQYVHSVRSRQPPAKQGQEPAGQPEPLHTQNEFMEVDLP